MKRFFILLCVILPAFARGHIGSPNVFFAGPAGPYPVRVIIRPPSVLPGTAQVDVRVDGAASVAVQAALWPAGTQSAPDPITAAQVAGETNLFNAAVWLSYSGSYSVHVRVEGNRGSGTAIVPLTSAALREPNMSAGLASVLVALGIILFVAAVWLVRMAARDSVLEPGASPAAYQKVRASVIAALATVIFACALHAGKTRWQKMDRDFRNNALYKPIPISAAVRTNGNLRLLQLTPPTDRTGATSWETLVADHGKLMHLFLLRDQDFNAFAHLHPVRRDAQTFENVLPPLPAGDYSLYAEITQESGLNQTLTAHVSLPGSLDGVPQMTVGSNRFGDVICQSPLPLVANAPQPFVLDMDDSWHTGASSQTRTGLAQECRLMGGLRMSFHNAGELLENRETSLRFSVEDSEGRPVVLQPYMGMQGHAVVRRADGTVFTHLHPVGTISMAAQQIFAQGEPSATVGAIIASNSLSGTPREQQNFVAFPYAFPRAGAYRVWTQVRVNARVLTGVFDISVQPAR